MAKAYICINFDEDKIREKAVKLTRTLMAVGCVYFRVTGHDERGANAVVQGEKMQGMAKVCLCCCMEFSETPLSLGQIASRKKYRTRVVKLNRLVQVAHQ